jgi:hypothetical protein
MGPRLLWALLALVALCLGGCLCWHHHGCGHHCCYPDSAPSGGEPAAGPAAGGTR